MRLIFTKSHTPLSWLIRHGLNEPVSHFAIVFDDKFTIHSNLYGVQLKWFKTFTKHATVMFSLDYSPAKLMEMGVSEDDLYERIMDNLDESPYDFKAFFYFLYRALIFRFFGKPIPKVSPFKDPKSFLCTELASQLPADILPYGTDLAITSPYTLFNLLLEQKNRLNL